MTLLERIADLSGRVEDLYSLEKQAQVRVQFELRWRELKEKSGPLRDALRTVQLLENCGLKVPSTMAEREAAVTCLDGIRGRFRGDPTPGALTKNKSWTELLISLDSATEALDRSAYECWCGYLGQLFAGETPEQIDGRIAKTDGNKRLLLQYRSAYDSYRRSRRELPSSDTEVKQGREAAAQLASLATQFDFNVPEEVKAFLDAVAQNRATLRHLTDGVRVSFPKSDTPDN